MLIDDVKQPTPQVHERNSVFQNQRHSITKLRPDSTYYRVDTFQEVH